MFYFKTRVVRIESINCIKNLLFSFIPKEIQNLYVHLHIGKIQCFGEY